MNKLIPHATLIISMLAAATPSMCQTVVRFDFTNGTRVAEWAPTHDIAGIDETSNGMVIRIKGDDPYSFGPKRDYPDGKLLWLTIRVKSEQGGMGQIFYFKDGKGPAEENSVRFQVRAGTWDTVKTPLPALGPKYHLRWDPPGDRGSCTVSMIEVSIRQIIAPPAWPRPALAHPGADAISVRSGDVELRQSRTAIGAFEVYVGGKRVATGVPNSVIGYKANGKQRWMAMDRMLGQHSAGNVCIASTRDEDGCAWTIRRTLRPASAPGAIEVETRVKVSAARNVVFLPLFLMLPGAGSFGTNKDHALFAGVEYLDRNEPSSSEADIRGAGSHRQTPDNLRVTFPLMVVQNVGLYVGMTWKPDPLLTPMFDSPDRQFHSGAHLMGVICPGSDGVNRIEGSLLPYEGVAIKAGAEIVSRVTVIGGHGDSVVPAVQQYVALNELPDPPDPHRNFQAYLIQSAHGWLDTKLREGFRYRHAYAPGGTFQPQAVADAPSYMTWMATQTLNSGLRQRLMTAADAGLSLVEKSEINWAAVSHVRTPAPSLMFGSVYENTMHAQAEAESLLTRFEPDGRILYKKSPNGLDYGATHFEKDANGLTAQVVSTLLEDAAFCGDYRLIEQALQRLNALDRFKNSAPRGAQTWEVPLHTPDILASAYLVRAYTLAFEITGATRYLESARYWAWTGVPFCYLYPPTEQPISLYATTPVFGATQWVAPDWMGLPVQWCGLVYSAALYRLAQVDAEGSRRWMRIADGITASGIQQSYPESEPELCGLLPDSFNLRPQTRNFAAINPGTLFANAVEYYNKPALYDRRVYSKAAVIVHAPCPITTPSDTNGRVMFAVHGWQEQPYYVLAVGLKKRPTVWVNEVKVEDGPSCRWHSESGRLILEMEPGKQMRVWLDVYGS